VTLPAPDLAAATTVIDLADEVATKRTSDGPSAPTKASLVVRPAASKVDVPRTIALNCGALPAILTVPAPLTVQATSPSSGTTASFTTGSATWNLGTLDANSNSSLHLTLMGNLPAGSTGQAVTITASLTADGINAGDAVASDSVQINP